MRDTPPPLLPLHPPSLEKTLESVYMKTLLVQDKVDLTHPLLMILKHLNIHFPIFFVYICLISHIGNYEGLVRVRIMGSLWWTNGNCAVTVIWVSPSFGHPRTQIPSDMGIPGRDAQNTDNIKYSRLGQVNSFEVLKTKCCLNIWFVNRVDD